MTDDMFPGQDRDGFPEPGGAFAGSFADEPPLTDMVPRAVAVYERGRRRRQAAGVGGGVAAVAATVLVATQVLGGPGPGTRGTGALSGSATPTHVPTPVTSASTPTSTPPSSPRSTPPGGPCDRTFSLSDVGTNVVPMPNQATAHQVCHEGLAAMAGMLPGHTWTPIVDPFASNGTYLADSYAPDGNAKIALATSISTKPYFTAHCSNVWYPHTSCQDVTLAEGMSGIEFGGEPSGGKPGGYTLYVDLAGGRQFQFQTGFEAGGPRALTLDGFLKLVKSTAFADYLKQYKTVLGS
ncbi:hypothetical protein ABH920_009706 [Catenulispora sp. EB89]|uniref:hypothetical protein n=1 Tax=Catenulispora sp. EB89 TaxID=3156257 RepID=UPI00351442C1